ncbi:hypothetical protein ZWY2020_017689 [Hordeum vulgare]|nr:hypothetical protein ZWY2020_017689 [Hordeum vulgare]
MRIPAPPPQEPEQVTTAEQGAAVPHFRAASSSTQAPPMDKQAWNAADAASEFLSPILNCYPLPQQPPNQQAMLQHLHYSGGPSHYVPCPAPQPSSSIRKPRTPIKPSGSQQTISVDNAEDGDKRTEKRLAWTSPEDVRLSDAQLLEKAHAFFESDYTTQFHHMDCWWAVNEHTKWTTYNEWLEQSKKRKMPETGEMGKHTSTPEDAEDIPRPPGIKKSKKECNGKGKSKEVAADMELLEKLVATHEESKKTRRDMIEMQQRSSSEKLEVARLSAETSRLSALAAKDNNEAKKQEKEAEMMRAYRALLLYDTIGMTDEMKNELVKTLKVMRERLFGT